MQSEECGITALLPVVLLTHRRSTGCGQHRRHNLLGSQARAYKGVLVDVRHDPKGRERKEGREGVPRQHNLRSGATGGQTDVGSKYC